MSNQHSLTPPSLCVYNAHERVCFAEAALSLGSQMDRSDLAQYHPLRGYWLAMKKLEDHWVLYVYPNGHPANPRRLEAGCLAKITMQRYVRPSTLARHVGSAVCEATVLLAMRSMG